VLLDGLRELGADVDVCNVPLKLDTAERVQILKQPWRLPLLALTILGTWLTLARRARALPKPDVVLVGYLGHFDVLLARRLFRRSLIVHDMLIFAADTAKDRGAGGLKQKLLRALDAAAIKASDVIVVDTDEHLAALPEDRIKDGVVVPVGAPHAWLGDVTPHEGPLRVVFFGLYTPLQAAPVIGEALALLPPGRVAVTMIGTGQDLAATRALAGDADVTWVDWVAPADLPALVQAQDVCLGIFAAEGKGTRVVPNKVYQGAAAGCAVVTSGTPPQRRALGDAGCFVTPGDPKALAAMLLELADDPALLLDKRTAAHALATTSFLPAAAAAPLHDRLLREASQ
jgi:glycosyltransferase involved in cell wall biosynthesis